MQKNVNVCSLFNRKKYKSTLLKIKLINILFLAGTLALSATSYSQVTKIDLSFRDSTSMADILRSIEKTSEFIFVYDASIVNMDMKTTISANAEKIELVLDKLFRGANVGYLIDDRQVLLYKKDHLNTLDLLIPKTATGIQQPQTRNISGTVTDSNGEPVIGASVVVKETTIGQTTGIDGKFQIKVPADAKALTISFIGMKPQEVDIIGKSSVYVQLEFEIVGLEEVVVIGYGVQKKESVVGAISVISNKTLTNRGGAVYNLSKALSGQIGGVTVMEVSGEPGRNDPQILIRGQSTWNGSQPLILVDGIERLMNDIDVNEVSSISVLKDASATAVFGVKGANGVILITTKRGEIGKPQLTFSAHQGIKSLSRIPQKMDSFEAINWKNAGIEREVATFENAWQYYTPYEQLLRFKKPQVDPYTYLYPNVDWQEVMLKDVARDQRYNLNASGGTEFAKYFASIGYSSEGDLFASEFNKTKNYDPGYAYDRLNFRGNLDFNLTKTTVLSTNINGYLAKRKEPYSDFASGGSGAGHIFLGLYELAPDAFAVKYPDGRYGKDPTQTNLNNPLAILQEGGVRNTNTRHVGTDVKLNQQLDFITKGLSAAANVAWDNYVSSDGSDIVDNGNQGQAFYTFITPAILDAKTKQDTLNATTYFATEGNLGINDFDLTMRPWNTNNESVTNNSLARSLFYQLSLNYARVFDKHNLTGLFLFNRRKDATGGEFAHFREDWVARTTYNYDNKYFVEFNGAYNGSEKFSSLYRFGFFPSMALGWMISKESFLNQYDWLSKLKIRGSIGKVGSDAGIPRWGYVGSWLGQSTSTMNIRNDGTYVSSPYTSYREGIIPNVNLRWETATKRNIGAEVSILEDMFTLNMDFFKDTRSDIFMSSNLRNIPVIFGAGPVPANLGATETKGYELELGVNKTWTNGLGFWVKTNMSKAKDVITKSEDPELEYAYRKNVGHAIGQTYSSIRAGYMNNWDDVFASSPAISGMDKRLPGDWDINDFNGDGVINNFDSEPFGYTQNPQFTYNATFGFSYKNFDIMVQFFAVRNITLSPYLVSPSMIRYTAVSAEYRDYWTAENTDAFYKAPRVTTSSSTGDFLNWDASMTRLKSAEISYRLPAKLTKRLGILSTRVYISGNNLILWSKFPEDRETGSVSSLNSYPAYKTIDMGIDVTF